MQRYQRLSRRCCLGEGAAGPLGHWECRSWSWGSDGRAALPNALWLPPPLEPAPLSSNTLRPAGRQPAPADAPGSAGVILRTRLGLGQSCRCRRRCHLAGAAQPVAFKSRTAVYASLFLSTPPVAQSRRLDSAARPNFHPVQAPLVGGQAPDFTATAVFDQEFVETQLSQYRVSGLAVRRKGTAAGGAACAVCRQKRAR